MTYSGELPSREDATSDATRLLCAGTYLDPVYRKGVIRELLTNRFRVVAPSYGYDAVPVLAHALAAHGLRRKQAGAVAAGAVVLALLVFTGVLGVLGGFLTFVWVLWAAAYLRRIATLHTLVTRLKVRSDGTGFDGGYPTTKWLSREIVGKIAHEQASGSGLVFYGGYVPFVGAGLALRRWHIAELLIGAPLNVFEKSLSGGASQHPADGFEDAAQARKDIIPFTVDELTSHVAERMAADLRDEAVPHERIEGLTVERRAYTTAVRTTASASGGALSNAPVAQGEDGYGTAREYLCIRVGSWNQELVTSMFVGFDIKGSTLHTQFNSYVLPPITESFHLVDRLPDALDGRLLVRVASDMVKNTPTYLLRLALRPLQKVLPERVLPKRLRGEKVRVEVTAPVDTSEFGLGRYAKWAVDCGALTSVREMAMHDDFYHFFQESDAIKYSKIVERRLLQIIMTFLADHNVDTADHRAQQNNVLQQHFGDNNTNNGAGNFTVRKTGEREGD